MGYTYETVSLPRDIDTLIDLISSSFSSTSDSSIEEWFSFSEMEKMIFQEKGVCIKAVDNKNQIVGIIYAQQESLINGKEGREKWVINMMAVLPDLTGKGIGSGLIKTIEEHARKRQVKKMFVFTNKEDNKVINFYKKNNYEDAGWIKDYQYEENNSAVFLLKYL